MAPEQISISFFKGKEAVNGGPDPVSYTHLDVYKRQEDQFPAVALLEQFPLLRFYRGKLLMDSLVLVVLRPHLLALSEDSNPALGLDDLSPQVIVCLLYTSAAGQGTGNGYVPSPGSQAVRRLRGAVHPRLQPGQILPGMCAESPRCV